MLITVIHLSLCFSPSLSYGGRLLAGRPLAAPIPNVPHLLYVICHHLMVTFAVLCRFMTFTKPQMYLHGIQSILSPTCHPHGAVSRPLLYHQKSRIYSKAPCLFFFLV